MKFAAAILTLALSAGAAGAFPATPQQKAARFQKIADFNSRMFSETEGNTLSALSLRSPAASFAPRKAGEFKPDEVLTEARATGTLEAPGGETWFYTSKKEYDYVVHNEYYSEPFLRTYSFTIYDSHMKEVGTIFDVMRYVGDEIKVPDIYLIPLVTKHFFNDDEYYEVAVSLAINTVTWGVMHFRNEVYSLGGGPKEKKIYKNKEVTVDVPVYTVEGRLGDVLDASTPDGPEDFYLTFFLEHVPTTIKYPDGYPEGATDEEINRLYWENICTGHIDYTIYTKKGDAPEIRKVYEHTIMTQKLPGDQESTPPMISLTHNGEVYFLFQEYKQTLANPYNEPHIDPYYSMRDANTLIVNLLKVEGAKAQVVNSIEIPFVKNQISGVLMTSMSVGSLRYREDIDFDNFDCGALPAYVVTKSDLYTTDQTLSSYYVYNPSGEKIRTIFEDAESFFEMSPVPGREQQINFVDKIGGVWNFNFVDFPSCRKVLTQCWLVDMGDDNDPERITANIDRALFRDGEYAYAAEMRVPLADDNDNDLMRVLWFDEKGTVLQVDEVNMGKAVYYAQVYIDGECLHPTLFYDDPQHEYMMLIKRGTQAGTTRTQEELLIGQPRSMENPDGRTLLHLTPQDGNGTLADITVIPGREPRLSVIYSKSGRYLHHLYYLPFGSSAVEEMTDDLTATPESGTVTVVAIDGRTLLRDAPADALRSLSPGIYIINGRKVAIGK